MMITISAKIPESQIISERDTAKQAAHAFFAENQDRDTCIGAGWYGRNIHIRRAHVEHDLDEAASLACKVTRGEVRMRANGS